MNKFQKILKINFLAIIVIIFSNKIYSSENKVLFKINDKSYTSLDIENRKIYLNFIGENETIDTSFIINDFISSIIFYEYYLNFSKENQDLDKKVIDIFTNIENSNKKNNKEVILKDKKNILENLTLDYVRKSILEEIVNSKKDEIFDKSEINNLLYNHQIKYLNISLNEINDEKINFINNNFKNFNNVEEYLIEENIEYFKKNSVISNINILDTNIKKNIQNKKYFFSIKKLNQISYVSINKEFRTYDSLIATIFSFFSNEQIDEKFVNCENILKLDKKIYQTSEKDYEYSKLNNKIRNKLIEIGDYITIDNNDTKRYVVLCGLKFNEDVFNNINVDQKINIIVKETERQFVKKFSKDFKLISNYE